MIERHGSFLSDEHRQMATEAFAACKEFVPAWALEVTLREQESIPDCQEATAYVEILPSYLALYVNLCPRWFLKTFEGRVAIIRHKLIDGGICYLLDYVRDNVLPYVKNQALRDLMDDEMTHRKEFAAENINLAIHEKWLTMRALADKKEPAP